MSAPSRPDLVVPASPGGPGPDPRAVRVTLAPASAIDGLPPLVVEPVETAGPTDRNEVLVNGAPVRAELRSLDAEHAILLRGDRTTVERLLLLPPEPASGPGRGTARREVVVDGWRIEVDVEPAARAALRERARRSREGVGPSGPTHVRAIIPGVVVSVSVAPGDAVAAGQQLLVVEAMKMQNELRAPRDGTIERVAVRAGGTLEVGDLLLVIS